MGDAGRRRQVRRKRDRRTVATRVLDLRQRDHAAGRSLPSYVIWPKEYIDLRWPTGTSTGPPPVAQSSRGAGGTSTTTASAPSGIGDLQGRYVTRCTWGRLAWRPQQRTGAREAGSLAPSAHANGGALGFVDVAIQNASSERGASRLIDGRLSSH